MKSYTGWTRTAKDRVITHGKAVLKAAYLTADSGGAAAAVLYEGVDTGGDRIISLKAAASGRDNLELPEPLLCIRGLFVDVGDNVEDVLILWDPVPDVPPPPPAPPPEG